MSAPPSLATNRPWHLDLDLSSKCNLRCTFCHLTYFKVKDPTQLSFADFEQHIAPLLPNLKSITLFSKYEPLICADFIEIFNKIQEYNIETYFSSNAILLSDKIIQAIVGRLTFLTVSITGFTPEAYKKHMGSDALPKVLENLRRLVAAKRAMGTEFPKLRLSTVGMLETVEHLTGAVDLAHELVFEEGIQVTSLIAYDDAMLTQMPLQDPERFMAAAQTAQRYAQEKGVKLVLQSGDMEVNEKDTQEMGHRPCYLPWQRLSVQPNGDVYPCPVAYKPIGNFNTDSLDEIWAGSALQEFRAGVNDPDRMNADCRDCTHCRHKSVTRKDGNDFSKTKTYIGSMVRKKK